MAGSANVTNIPKMNTKINTIHCANRCHSRIANNSANGIKPKFSPSINKAKPMTKQATPIKTLTTSSSERWKKMARKATK